MVSSRCFLYFFPLFSLEIVCFYRKFFEYETDEAQHIDAIIRLLEDQEKQVDEKLRQLQKDSAHVHHKVKHYKAIKHALENDLPLPVWEDE